jgi:hypothetical protein
MICSYYPGVRLDRLSKTTKTLVRVADLRARSEPEPPKVEAELTTTQ